MSSKVKKKKKHIGKFINKVKIMNYEPKAIGIKDKIILT